MAEKRKEPAKKPAPKKVPPELVEEDGQFYIVSGTKRLDVGRNERYAKRMLEDLK
jgi:hypothetical protein